jgi:hypothetical protein
MFSYEISYLAQKRTFLPNTYIDFPSRLIKAQGHPGKKYWKLNQSYESIV